MSYYFSKITDCAFDEAVQRTVGALQQEGFGVLTDIDIQATLKKKLDVDFKKYRILGACHPSSAYKALQAEDKIGTMLPCNVIVQELAPGKTEIAAVNPIASMMAIQNEQLAAIASEITQKLERVIDRL
ncbi:MAG: DUF302 domain-containing protein [Bacteroidales bacterium]